ncbi:hypothetical protein TQ39_11675 [Ruthenibacterium lactatiformans]|uniref:Uncharacterized protein n=1 Tax=Ruthenibacterium lactatiformans TaxID=1550024 RepID=A0A0D8IYG6_9FIRM|nr:hypothetical protein TQ39_11675 [Ruthenibacterium lactatiformans]
MIQGFFVKRAKSFVNKHGIKLNTTGRCLDLIRESQCKRERRLEGFTTRKCLYTSFCAVVMVNNVKIESALATVILGFFSTFQLILSSGHNHKASIATVYKGNIIKNLIMDCQSYTKYRPNETTGGIFVSWRRKEELPTGA